MERFKDYLGDFIRRGKQNTAKTYKSALTQFNAWLEAHDKQDNFDDKEVLVFLDEQVSWSSTAKNTCLKALKGWAKYEKTRIPTGSNLEELLRGTELGKRYDRIADVKGYTVVAPIKSALSINQIKRLFDVMDSDAATLWWVLCWFGVRLNEIKRIAGVNWEEMSITIGTEKTPGHRTLFFDVYTGKLLHHAIESGLLAWHGQKIWSKLKYYSTEVEPVKLTPHLARHCFASFFADIINAEFPGDRDTLRIMLGHTPADVTGIYIHSTRIRDLMQNKHFLKPLEPKAE